MKFLSKLDPMTVLMLVVIFGVVITMTSQASTSDPITQAVKTSSQEQVKFQRRES